VNTVGEFWWKITMKSKGRVMKNHIVGQKRVYFNDLQYLEKKHKRGGGEERVLGISNTQ